MGRHARRTMNLSALHSAGYESYGRTGHRPSNSFRTRCPVTVVTDVGNMRARVSGAIAQRTLRRPGPAPSGPSFVCFLCRVSVQNKFLRWRCRSGLLAPGGGKPLKPLVIEFIFAHRGMVGKENGKLFILEPPQERASERARAPAPSAREF